MEKARRGTATAFGLFDAVYQLVIALVLILFCSDKGGIAYGVGFVLSALASGALTIFARKKDWAKRALLLLGMAQVFAIFVVGFALGMVLPKGKNVASAGILLLRSVAFYSGATLLIGGVMLYTVDEYKRSQFTLVTAIYKLLSLVGVAFYFIIPALMFWKATAKAAFNEWLLSRGGENPDLALLIDEFEMWTGKWNPIFQGIGMLLMVALPTFLWYLDSRGLFFKNGSQKKTYILTGIGGAFLIAADVVMIMNFVSDKKLAYLIFAIVNLLVYAGLWAFYYILPKKMGWDKIVYVDENELAETAVADEKAEAVLTVSGAPADGGSDQ